MRLGYDLSLLVLERFPAVWITGVTDFTDGAVAGPCATEFATIVYDLQVELVPDLAGK